MRLRKTKQILTSKIQFKIEWEALGFNIVLFRNFL